MNDVKLSGRLTADPEIKTTQNGKNIARYRLAVDRRFKKEGEQTADFISCVAFGHNADFAGKYLRKGVKIIIGGSIRTGSYTNNDGATVYTTDVVVDWHEFCEKRETTSSSNGYPQSTAYAAPTPSYMPDAYMPQNAPSFEAITDDDELPF